MRLDHQNGVGPRRIRAWVAGPSIGPIQNSRDPRSIGEDIKRMVVKVQERGRVARNPLESSLEQRRIRSRPVDPFGTLLLPGHGGADLMERGLHSAKGAPKQPNPPWLEA